MGLNPLQLGLIGSTDTHTGTPGQTDEDAFLGHFNIDVTAASRAGLLPDGNPGGLVGVWAEENTRASLFDAMKNRQVIATSGPRISAALHHFWSESRPHVCADTSPEGATPMGATLADAPAGARPWLRVLATADEQPLERIDIIRIALEDGELQESVHSHALEPVDGNGSQCVSWADDNFDPAAPTLWYARVLEVPTPRWSKIDCERGGLECPEQSLARRDQSERAWTSPVWYLP